MKKNVIFCPIELEYAIIDNNNFGMINRISEKLSKIPKSFEMIAIFEKD